MQFALSNESVFDMVFNQVIAHYWYYLLEIYRWGVNKAVNS